jgi:plastocyanin
VGTMLLVAITLLGMSGAGVVTPVAGSQTVTAVALSFVPPTLQLKAGDDLQFQNLDPAGGGHSVTSAAQNAGTGAPLFTSGIVSPGSKKDVGGVSGLPAGSYPFKCQIHGFMKGTLVVS